MELVIFCLLFTLFICAYKRAKWAILPIGGILIAFVGFRDVSVGTDTANYSFYFQVLKHGGPIHSEYLYGFLNKLVIFVNGEYFWVQLLSAILVVVPVFFVIHKKSPYPYLSIFLYLTLYIYFYSFNIVRQSIAISLCFLAVSYFFKNRLWYFGLVITAINFHASAIIMVPLYFIDKISPKGRHIAAALLITFVIGIFLPSYIINIAAFLGYANYIEGGFALGSLIGNMFYLILLNTVFFVIYKFEKDKSNTLFLLFFLFLVVSNLLIRFPYGNRIILYFSIFQVLYFPILLNSLRKKEKSMLFVFLIIYALFTFYIFYGNGQIFPYESILENR